jgi:hypothetical protein
VTQEEVKAGQQTRLNLLLLLLLLLFLLLLLLLLLLLKFLNRLLATAAFRLYQLHTFPLLLLYCTQQAVLLQLTVQLCSAGICRLSEPVQGGWPVHDRVQGVAVGLEEVVGVG